MGWRALLESLKPEQAVVTIPRENVRSHVLGVPEEAKARTALAAKGDATLRFVCRTLGERGAPAHRALPE
jgi:hypothetical protein